MSLPRYVNPRYDWNATGFGTYWYHKLQGGFEERPIPKHPQLREIYNLAFDFACENYCKAKGTLSNCIALVEEQFGPMSQEMRDYITYGPYDAGDRAGMLREEPDHYE